MILNLWTQVAYVEKFFYCTFRILIYFLQAMSRVWRDGQKHPVHIYRLLTTGSNPSVWKKVYSLWVNKGILCVKLCFSTRNIILLASIIINIFYPTKMPVVKIWRKSNECFLFRYNRKEKIYQRQISKQGLSGAVVDLSKTSDHIQFSVKNLKICSHCMKVHIVLLMTCLTVNVQEKIIQVSCILIVMMMKLIGLSLAVENI